MQSTILTQGPFTMFYIHLQINPVVIKMNLFSYKLSSSSSLLLVCVGLKVKHDSTFLTFGYCTWTKQSKLKGHLLVIYFTLSQHEENFRRNDIQLKSQRKSSMWTLRFFVCPPFILGPNDSK